MEKVRVTKICSEYLSIPTRIFEGKVRLTIEAWYNPLYDESSKYIKVEFINNDTNSVVEVALFHQDQREKLNLYLKEHLTKDYAKEVMKSVREHLPEKFMYTI